MAFISSRLVSSPPRLVPHIWDDLASILKKESSRGVEFQVLTRAAGPTEGQRSLTTFPASSFTLCVRLDRCLLIAKILSLILVLGLLANTLLKCDLRRSRQDHVGMAHAIADLVEQRQFPAVGQFQVFGREGLLNRTARDQSHIQQ